MARQITKRRVDALKPGDVVWDGLVKGFCVRRQADAVTYGLKYRAGRGRMARQRWLTIGRHGSPFTVEEARTEAKRLLGTVANGEDPAATRDAMPAGTTVAELCDLYFSAAKDGRVRTRFGAAKRTSTLTIDAGRIARHIKPILGRRLVKDVTGADVADFLAAVASGKTAAKIKTRPRGLARVTGGETTAARAVGLLGAIFAFAKTRGLRSDNPVHGIARPRDRKRDRVLDADDYKAVGRAIKSRDWHPHAVGALKLLAMTGARRGEIVGLRWSEVDAKGRSLRLGNTKSGASVRPLGKAALDVLAALPRHAGSDFVFPATSGRGHYQGLPKVWRALIKAAEIKAATIHALRHSLASHAAAEGYAEATVAALIGHRRHTVTARYTHALDHVLIAAADRMAQSIADMLAGKAAAPAGKVLKMRRATA